MLNTIRISLLALLCAGAAQAEDRTGQTIRLGVDPTYPPLEYKQPDGSLTGFGIEITEAICAELRANCIWVESGWDGIIPSLQARKFDVIASSMTITEKRAEQIAFSDKYSNAPSRLVARKGSGLEPTAASLRGKRIGVQQGSSQETFARAAWMPEGVEIVSYQTQDQIYADLISGRLDASLQASIQASEGFLKKPEGAGFEFAGPDMNNPAYFGVGSGYGFRKDDAALREDWNKAFAAIRADGTYRKINDKYFDFDVYGD
ncbi:ABC transporter substrate-binding protein [Paracoccus sp. MKU1]|uniref:ABC transporter substrate-binding protein n=1 Tax=Paracoccus sp. MKU1 TaxID=1745182 RepID=UPI0007192CBF|nr:ABC transporter substrate-binding protein [Paracoccus sp. MKU1]KRW97842.1 ABC transporter substrate-binding protein [Paracoccus sp. MKU1]